MSADTSVQCTVCTQWIHKRCSGVEKKGRVYDSRVRSGLTFGCETRPLLADVVLKFETAEM